MTIDSHSYLVSRGWKGKGNALREGGISRPIIQAQKKDQKGLGKNREDGFQFWDHVYAAAADAIKIHVEDSEGDEDDIKRSSPSSLGMNVVQENEGAKLCLTRTGIISNRRPTELQKISTGEVITHQSGRTGLDLLVLAKREAARRELYSRFYRGGVVHQERMDPPDSNMGEVPKGTTVTQTDKKWGAGVDLPGDDVRESRREKKRKRKEERKVTSDSRKKKEKKREKGQRGNGYDEWDFGSSLEARNQYISHVEVAFFRE